MEQPKPKQHYPKMLYKTLGQFKIVKNQEQHDELKKHGWLTHAELMAQSNDPKADEPNTAELKPTDEPNTAELKPTDEPNTAELKPTDEPKADTVAQADTHSANNQDGNLDNKLDRAEVRAKLDELGVKYDPKARTEALVKLLEKHV